MEFHLDKKLQLETGYSSLYSWAIKEVNDNGEVVGRDQIPWNWSLYFTATEIFVSDTLTVAEAYDDQGVRAQRGEVEFIRTIRARLRPDGPRGDDDSITYSMFGTDRVINDFALNIAPLETDHGVEIRRAWGCVGYTPETHFPDETTEDCIEFSLRVKPSTFDHYVARISGGTADEVILCVRGVAGFYSEWSPSISTLHVKVLTPGDEQNVLLPAHFEGEPPRLGSVGKASLYINAKRLQARAQTNTIADGSADEEHQFEPSARSEAAQAQLGVSAQTMQLLQSVKTAIHWIVGLLVLLVITTLLAGCGSLS